MSSEPARERHTCVIVTRLAQKVQLQRCVRTDEDRLQIHPLPLHVVPDVERFYHHVQGLLPGPHLLRVPSYESRTTHGLEVEEVVLELQIYFFRGAEHVAPHLPVLLVLSDVELRRRPALLDAINLLLYFQFVDRACVASSW